MKNIVKTGKKGEGMTYRAFEVKRGWGETYFDLDLDEIRECGGCGHFDSSLNACWVVASDGIVRDAYESMICVFGFNEEMKVVKK